MSGKCRPHLIRKTLENVNRCKLSQTDKDCINAVFERFIPKKPKIYNNVYPKDLYECPNCQCGLRANATWKDTYCCNCGLKIDWSDTE